MKMPCRAPNANLQLDYVRDTLFGPVALSVECQCQLAALNLQGRPALRLHICPPLPDKVERAHSVASSGMAAAITAWCATRVNVAMAASTCWSSCSKPINGGETG